MEKLSLNIPVNFQGAALLKAPENSAQLYEENNREVCSKSAAMAAKAYAQIDSDKTYEPHLKIIENADLINAKIDSIQESILPDVVLSDCDKKFLRANAFSSKYHKPEDYIRGFVYFRDLKTKSGDRILDSSTFLNKSKGANKNELEKERLDILYNNIKELLNINPNSIESSYIEIFLHLIQMGAVHKSAIRILPNGSNGQANWTLSPNVKKDIDRMCDVMEFNEDPRKINAEIKDDYVPTYETDETAYIYRDIGDVYLLEGCDKIKIKTAPDKVHMLDISKDTYCKLFPPVERFASCQQTFGDCYCIESLMALYNDPEMRVYLLDLLSEDNRGNITIRFPKSKPVVFENGELPKTENEEAYSSGAKGYKLFEYAYAKTKLMEKVLDTRHALPEERLKDFHNFIKSNGDNIFIYKEDDIIKWTTFNDAMMRNFNKDKPQKSGYDNYTNYLLGNGGQEIDIYNKIGLCALMYSTAGAGGEKVADRLFKEMGSIEFFDKNIVHLGIGGHAYGLSAETLPDGDISYILYNPHSQGIPLKLNNLDQLRKNLQTITIVRKK